MDIPTLKDEDLLRFWGKVNLSTDKDSCWEWTRGLCKGYGMFSLSAKQGERSKPFRAHRVSYFICNNTDPKESIVMHKCDNPKCVNPDHLSLGNTRDNALDMMSKNRGRKQFKNGEEHTRSKLSNKDVLFIRSSDLRQQDLADKFNINQALVSRIKNKNHGNTCKY